MGIELFGATHVVYIAAACFIAYLCSGHSGIYLSQRVGVPKTRSAALPSDISLRQLRELGRPASSAAIAPPPPGITPSEEAQN